MSRNRQRKLKNKIAERFKEIICNAATIKRKRKKTTELVSQSQETTVDATILPSIKEQYGALLVAEEHSVCPNDGCSTPLFVNCLLYTSPSPRD